MRRFAYTMCVSRLLCDTFQADCFFECFTRSIFCMIISEKGVCEVYLTIMIEH